MFVKGFMYHLKEVREQTKSSDSGVLARRLKERYACYHRHTNVAVKRFVEEYMPKVLAAEGDENEKNKIDSVGRKKVTSTTLNNDVVVSVKENSPPPSSSGKKRSFREMMVAAVVSPNDSQVVRKYQAVIPKRNLCECGGIEKIAGTISELIVYPLSHPEIYQHLGVSHSNGVLLHGPPGTGKSFLAEAIAGSACVPFFRIAATELISGMSGESEEQLRDLFVTAKLNAPCLVFIDEIDVICQKRGQTAREMEKRIVAQLLLCFDDLAGSGVIVLGATNRPDSIDPAMRRAGRFDREISVGMPDYKSRLRILAVMTKRLRTRESENASLLDRLARATPGFVAADLSALVKEAAILAIRRGCVDLSWRKETYLEEELQDVFIESDDFHEAIKHVQPSARREGFTTLPTTTWKQVGGLMDLQKELELTICEPIRRPEIFAKVGLSIPAGVLLHGPPGCGKTLVAKAVAKESGANLIAIKGPEILNKYVGESERAIRDVFARATVSAPCIVFFDELDSLCPKRCSESSGSAAADRVVNQLLTELDGVQDRSEVFVIAATNRLDILDPAMLRPGRLDKLLYVPLPDDEAREDILRRLAEKAPVGDTVDFKKIANYTDGYTGADLHAVVREATMTALGRMHRDDVDGSTVALQQSDFLRSVDKVKPSVTHEEHQNYLQKIRR